MRDALFVAFGGSLGALARYGVGLVFPHTPGKHFPVATLLVNLVGCLLIGMIGQLLQRFAADASVKHQTGDLLITTLRQGMIVGFLGAYTTFSMFGAETYELTEIGHWGLAFLNVAASAAAGVAAVALGQALGRLC